MTLRVTGSNEIGYALRAAEVASGRMLPIRQQPIVVCKKCI